MKAPILCLSPRRAAILSGAVFALGLITSAQGVVLIEEFNLGATAQSTSTWTDLSNTNAAFAPDAGSDGGTFAVSGAFQASFGVYSFSQDYTATVTQGTSYDVQHVVFQLELSPNPGFSFPFNGGPLLSINGGQYVLVPDSYLTGQSEARNTFGSDPLTYIDAVWQWDLSGITDAVTSVSVLTPVSIHTSTVGAQIDTASSFNGFVTPVPEPSALILSLAGAGALVRRRRN